MKKKILYLISVVVMSLGLSVFAQTIFEIDELFFTETGILSGDYSTLHFNFSGNDFDGLIFWGTTLNQTGELTMGTTTINCDKQINGLYLNTARGSRMWPLDQETLAVLSGSTSFAGYGDLEFTGGFFTQCDGVGIDNDAIYGYIKHTYDGTEYEMWAGLDFDLTSGNPIDSWSGSLQYTTVPSYTADGYVFDNHGGTAKVYSNMELYGEAELTGESVTHIELDDYLSTGKRVNIKIFSNKEVNYEITGDIVSVMTGYLPAQEYAEIPVELTNTINQKNITVNMYSGTSAVSKAMSVTLQDNQPPSVSLISPNNGGVITSNDIELVWTGNDNISMSHYSVYLDGNGISMSRPIIDYPISSQSIPVLPNGTYDWYVVATDNGANTGQTTPRTFTISGDIGGPMLISPADNASINIGELNLLRSAIGESNSGYTWQIATSNTFNTIVADGTTNNTGITAIHNPNFMTGLFYWRVINNETAGISETRRVNISDIGINLDTRVNEFSFDIINAATPTETYTSNEITIGGLTNNIAVLARLENNIGALFINNVMVGSQGLVKNNDEIRIEMISSTGYSMSVETILLVGTGDSLVSGIFEINTHSGINYNNLSFNLPYALRIQAILFIDSLAEMYQDNPQAFASFLTTFDAILQDRSDLIQNHISQNTDIDEIELLQLQKDSIDYLIFVVNEYLYDINYNIANIYIAPNGKQYLVQFDENRFAYTSPDFMYSKYFPTWELFKRHIDINNPGDYYDEGVVGDTITTPNGKIYTIHIENNKWTSNNMIHKKYFDNRDQIIEYIMINNPSTVWDHQIDTSFTPVVFVAPNGKNYTIFKTSSTGNNPDKYSSFMFVTPKYFGSLQSAQNHIVMYNN